MTPATNEEFKQDFGVFDCELSDSEINQINKLNKDHHCADPINWWGIPYFQ